MNEILVPIVDIHWKHQIENAKLIESIQYWRYRFDFYEILEQFGWVSFVYRMFCFCPSFKEPIIALNVEYVRQRAKFFGIEEADGHLNYGRAKTDITYPEFYEWAFETARARIEEAKRIRYIIKTKKASDSYFN
ncbi:MAG: hypothetical protein ACI86H_001694 [bacterium]|jgi:hypothetical protein